MFYLICKNYIDLVVFGEEVTLIMDANAEANAQEGVGGSNQFEKLSKIFMNYVETPEKSFCRIWVKTFVEILSSSRECDFSELYNECPFSTVNILRCFFEFICPIFLKQPAF